MSYLHLVINHGCPIWTPLGLEKLSSQSAAQASLQGLKDTDTHSTQALSSVATGLVLGEESGECGNPGPQNQKEDHLSSS